MTKHFNALTEGEQERLSILLEELGEAQQCIGKILRHGYESYNPVVDTGMTNRRELERELGDIYAAIQMLIDKRDVNEIGIKWRMGEKQKSIKQWLHHQTSPAIDYSDMYMGHKF